MTMTDSSFRVKLYFTLTPFANLPGIIERISYHILRCPSSLSCSTCPRQNSIATLPLSQNSTAFNEAVEWFPILLVPWLFIAFFPVLFNLGAPSLLQVNQVVYHVLVFFSLFFFHNIKACHVGNSPFLIFKSF